MKRFLILFSLIAFVTVSCAGPNKASKAGWTKPDFRQEQFEIDRKECVESIETNLDSEVFGKALEECLENKGYSYQTSQEADETKKESATMKGIKTAGMVVGGVLLGVTLTALYLALVFAPRK